MKNAERSDMFEVEMHFLEYWTTTKWVQDPAAKSYDETVHHFKCWSKSSYRSITACLDQNGCMMTTTMNHFEESGFFVFETYGLSFVKLMKEHVHGFFIKYVMNEEGKYDMKECSGIIEDEARLWKLKME